MINLDMVGRLGDDPKIKKPTSKSAASAPPRTFESLIDELNKKYEFDIKKTRSGTGPSDHTSFYVKGVPVFFFFTGLHPDYHRPTDKPEKINFEGMKKVVDMVEELAAKIATEKERPEYVGAKAGKDGASTATPRGIPSIRFMPGDYDDDQTNGVLVGGVTPGGPGRKRRTEGRRLDHRNRRPTGAKHGRLHESHGRPKRRRADRIHRETRRQKGPAEDHGAAAGEAERVRNASPGGASQ